MHGKARQLRIQFIDFQYERSLPWYRKTPGAKVLVPQPIPTLEKYRFPPANRTVTQIRLSLSQLPGNTPRSRFNNICQLPKHVISSQEPVKSFEKPGCNEIRDAKIQPDQLSPVAISSRIALCATESFCMVFRYG